MHRIELATDTSLQGEKCADGQVGRAGLLVDILLVRDFKFAFWRAHQPWEFVECASPPGILKIPHGPAYRSRGVDLGNLIKAGPPEQTQREGKKEVTVGFGFVPNSWGVGSKAERTGS